MAIFHKLNSKVLVALVNWRVGAMIKFEQGFLPFESLYTESCIEGFKKYCPRRNSSGPNLT